MNGGPRRKGVFAKVEMVCPVCRSPFLIFPTTAKRRVHCSKKCYAEHQKTLVGKLSVRYGAKVSDEARKRMSDISKLTNRRGKDHYSWKGGRRTWDGYVMLYLPALQEEDQEYFPRSKGREKYIFEHRLVVSRKLGRVLEKHEHVHHVNGIRSDNREENLELLTDDAHRKEHARVLRDLRRLKEDNYRLSRKIEELEKRLPDEIPIENQAVARYD